MNMRNISSADQYVEARQRRRTFKKIAMLVSCVTLISMVHILPSKNYANPEVNIATEKTAALIELDETTVSADTPLVDEIEIVEVEADVEEVVDVEQIDYGATDEEIALIALVTMAEAEGECEEGKRLVIDTILNRVDHARFPNTISEVIYQPHQFTSMWNGRVNRCEVREDICQLVREELLSRTNSDCIFFRTDYYSSYGTPMFQVGCHYFSSY